MSARPRPVTGTYYEPVTSTPKQRRYSLSSGTSTESLISILNHDSYESPVDSEDEEEKRIAAKETKHLANKPEITGLSKSENTELSSEADTAKDSQDTKEKEEGTKDTKLEELTAWEKWLVQKSKELRLQQKQEVLKKKIEREKGRKQEEEKREKTHLVEEKVKQWIERKNMEIKVKENENKIKKQTESELKQQEQEKIEEKAKEKYQEWLNQKQAELKQKKKKEKQMKKEEELKKLEKQKKSEQAYEAWCNKAKQRPKSAPRSFGYTSGKLTGYHDTNAYPIPSFFNPIPWQPIHVPQPKSERPKRKKVKKYAWNPNKYL